MQYLEEIMNWQNPAFAIIRQNFDLGKSSEF